MNEASCVVYVAVFLALPPALLTARAIDKTCMPWRLLLAVSLVGGWLLANLAHRFHIQALALQMAATGTQGAAGGFAQDNFVFHFGGVIGLVYLLPWLFLYCVFVVARWMFVSRR